MREKMETMTIREAIRLFPGLLDEVVTFGEKESVPMKDSSYLTFQFKGDGNYRTKRINRITAEDEVIGF